MSLDRAHFGTFAVGGELNVSRIGLGTNRVTDSERSREVLRRAVELGVNHIDTADSYTGNQSETVIGQTLAPYEGVIAASKGGMRTHLSDGAGNSLPSTNDIAYMDAALDGSRERLRVETIDLYYLHRIVDDTPFREILQFLKRAQQEGRIRHIGLSDASVAQLEAAREILEVAAVQNEYGVFARKHEDVLRYAEEHGMAFVPFFPLRAGMTDERSRVIARVAERHGVAAPQVAIAWLLQHSPNLLPIPGTQSVEHLEANVGAGALELTQDDLDELEAA